VPEMKSIVCQKVNALYCYCSVAMGGGGGVSGGGGGRGLERV